MTRSITTPSSRPFGDGVNPGNIKPGESKRIALMKRGKFRIECVYHDAMTIAVNVK